jgi:hypothetical protein
VLQQKKDSDAKLVHLPELFHNHKRSQSESQSNVFPMYNTFSASKYKCSNGSSDHHLILKVLNAIGHDLLSDLQNHQQIQRQISLHVAYKNSVLNTGGTSDHFSTLELQCLKW